MPTAVTCPSCHADVEVASGGNTRCLACGNRFAVHRWRTAEEESSPGAFTYLDVGSRRIAGSGQDPWADAGEVPLRGPATVIGRCGDVLVLDARASRQHAVIERHGTRFLLRDLGSRNGTLLNGAPVVLAPLGHRDEIRIGSSDLRFLERPRGKASIQIRRASQRRDA